MGNNPDTRQPKSLLDHFYAWLQQAWIAPKLVDDEPFEQCPVGGFEEFHSSEQRGKYTASINISNQDARSVRCVRHAEIDDIVLLQVDFRRRSRSLQQDEVVLGRKFLIALKHDGE